MMRSQPSSRPTGDNVLAMPSRSSSPPRTLNEIISAQRAARERHAAEMDALERELAAAAGAKPAMPAGRTVSLQQAAHLVNWRIPRLRGHIMRRANRPDLPQLGFQPGNVANSPWFVNVDVLMAYVAGQDRSR